MEKSNNHAIALTEKQFELIERLSNFGCGQGIQPAAASITALLMVSDKTELTFDEIRETLSLSKSATSNGINYLLMTEKISFITKTGDRKRYFRSDVASWKESFTTQFQSLGKFCELLNEIKDVRTKETTEFNSSIEDLYSFITYFLEEIPKIYQKWEKKRIENL